MFLKAFGFLAPVMVGGAWLGGVFDATAYSREVARTPEQVMGGSPISTSAHSRASRGPIHR